MESSGRKARMWWVPDQGAWADSRHPRGLSCEQPDQIHIFIGHLWGSVGIGWKGRQEAGQGAQEGSTAASWVPADER